MDTFYYRLELTLCSFNIDVSEQDAFGFRYHKRVKRTQHTEVVRHWPSQLFCFLLLLFLTQLLLCIA